MKIKTFFTIIILFLLPGVVCFGAEDEQKDISQIPLAVALEPDFAFESALEGDEVIHDFIIQNKGTAELKIERVQTG
ncbi:Uncharacterized protein dnl_49980 [Desulfonema limicola]|nr:Uncharacterized protein dnl_49980 [Desulfonema limicola]